MHRLLAALAAKKPGTASQELEEVLFYWRDVGPYLKKHPLSGGWGEFLRTELARGEARVRVRVRGDDGTTYIAGDHTFRLGKRTHVHPGVVRGVQPLEITATVRRVGHKHLWTRL